MAQGPGWPWPPPALSWGGPCAGALPPTSKPYARSRAVDSELGAAGGQGAIAGGGEPRGSRQPVRSGWPGSRVGSGSSWATHYGRLLPRELLAAGPAAQREVPRAAWRAHSSSRRVVLGRFRSQFSVPSGVGGLVSKRHGRPGRRCPPLPPAARELHVDIRAHACLCVCVCVARVAWQCATYSHWVIDAICRRNAESDGGVI